MTFRKQLNKVAVRFDLRVWFFAIGPVAAESERPALALPGSLASYCWQVVGNPVSQRVGWIKPRGVATI
jgi:hypothetical protein